MNILNLNDFSKEERLKEMTASFNNLNTNQILVVSSNDDFFETIDSFQSEQDGKFFWAVLRKGPDLWKGELLKTEENSNIQKSLFSFMDLDHKRCDRLYAAGESLIFDNKKEEGVERIKEFIVGMLRHFLIEESLLFPAFEENTGMVQGPTSMMRMEHEQMTGLLAQMAAAANDNEYDSITGVGETLVVLMQQHNVKEEGMLYPMMDQHLASINHDLISKAMKIDYKK
ncbi:MAG: hemerythrin domain-containing protein [Flavobacteriaceae bacterium]|nr:hemerythrin domain-containing protein [Flavobacteriaceae bacterium]